LASTVERDDQVIVRNWMTTKVVTINKEASIQESLALMKQASVRHLPIVDEDGILIGWVTDADLRGVLIASMLEELTLEDVMIRKPFTAYPEMPLEEAARLVLENRIGGLPVLDEGKLAGVITVVDIMSAFITIMGMLTQSSRLDVKVSNPEHFLDGVTRLIQDYKAEVISICHLPGDEEQGRVYSFRLKKCDLKPIVSELEKKGIEVVSSIS
jgi:acetoin utilization protein AcuB